LNNQSGSNGSECGIQSESESLYRNGKSSSHENERLLSMGNEVGRTFTNPCGVYTFGKGEIGGLAKKSI
jgi:hypothetical protein